MVIAFQVSLCTASQKNLVFCAKMHSKIAVKSNLYTCCNIFFRPYLLDFILTDWYTIICMTELAIYLTFL